jgi:hypothetical protein
LTFHAPPHFVSSVRIVHTAAIDPGRYGAIALGICEVGVRHARLLEVAGLFDMPMLDDGPHAEVDFHKLRAQLVAHGAEFGFIEKQNAMPKQSATASWAQAINYRDAYNALRSCCPGTIAHHASRWKPLMNVTADKETCLIEARRRHPDCAPLLQLKKHDGRAEALLMQDYMIEHLLNQDVVEVV